MCNVIWDHSWMWGDWKPEIGCQRETRWIEYWKPKQKKEILTFDVYTTLSKPETIIRTSGGFHYGIIMPILIYWAGFTVMEKRWTWITPVVRQHS